MRKKQMRVVAVVFLVLAFSGLLMSCGRKSRTVSYSRRQNAEATRATTPIIRASTVQTEPAAEDGLIYSDTRIPNYSACDPEWATMRFEWTCQNNRGSAWMEITLDKQMYACYRNLERYYGVENYYLYVNDANNQEIIRSAVKALREIAQDLSYDDAAVAREIAKFVQDCIVYQKDLDTTGQKEYPRYPIETLYERQGDCEDTSILMAALLKEWGYEVGFLHLPGHVAVAIRTSDDYAGGSYYEINGHRYLFIESTGSNWNIGDIPNEFRETAAQFYLIP